MTFSNSISKIQFHIQKTTSLIDFSGNITITDAVERRLAIIGEAVWKITKIDSSVKISEYKKIISLRHILIHEYDLIDKGTLWRIIETDLPLLKQETENILNSLEN
jgi:uncharacterized protein with HEPN domain